MAEAREPGLDDIEAVDRLVLGGVQVQVQVQVSQGDARGDLQGDHLPQCETISE